MFGEVHVLEDMLQCPDSRLIRVQCQRCGEVINREARLYNKRHHCNTNTGGWCSRILDLVIHKLAGLTDYNIRLECKIEDSNAKLPTRTRSTDAGYDLYTITTKTLVPGEVARFETGLRISAPEGWYYTIEGRSSLWSRGIVPFRGIIDGGYVGLIGVHIMNVSSTPYEIKLGDRVAQMILHKVRNADLFSVTAFSSEYNHRGDNGFGSTGR